MRELPILYNSAMVRAVLDDSKTQTRRVIKPQPTANYTGEYIMGHALMGNNGKPITSPYGLAGDQLWVKETSRVGANGWHQIDGDWHYIEYKADNKGRRSDSKAPYHYPKLSHNRDLSIRWHPSIFMPRWASRIQLEITNVRVERLNDITRGDCMSEGCPFPNIAKETDPKKWFMDLWESMNGAGSWSANPWVWVIEFKKINAK